MRRVSPPLWIVIVPAGTAKPFGENWIVTLHVATAGTITIQSGGEIRRIVVNLLGRARIAAGAGPD